MTHLRLVTDEVGAGPFDAGSPLPTRLPPGRHGIPTNLVAEHQRRRLITAMAEALAEHGYANVTAAHVSARASVSIRTFYKHFGNLWDCLLAAYVATANHLCTQVEAATDDPSGDSATLATGIGAALAFISARPEQGRLLSTQPPREAVAIGAARRRLIERLATMLHGDQGADMMRPPGIDERLIDAALAFVGARIAAGEVEALDNLAPELTAILARPRRAA